jgi:hypothetical protein
MAGERQERKHERRAFLRAQEACDGLDRAEAVELARLDRDIESEAARVARAMASRREDGVRVVPLAPPAWSLPLGLPPGLPSPMDFPPLEWPPPRTPLVLVADEPRLGSLRLAPFAPRVNHAAWQGPRVVDGEQCGGGRRIVRKAETDS